MNIKKMLKVIINPFLPICFKVFPELKCINDYRYNFGRMPNLINPKTLNEKILRKMLFDRNPRLTIFADKFLVRDFVKSRLGEDSYLTKLYGVVDNPAQISGLSLPNQFVMKPNHLSGQIKIINDFMSLAPDELEKLAETWLRMSHYRYHNEWAYKNIKPRIIFEESLEFEMKIPDDWKFFCFRGEPRFIQIDRSRFVKHKRNIYNLSFSLLPVNLVWENIQEKIVIPQNFEKMLEIARKLSAGVDFIRVDLYNVNGRIVFGELTSYPGAGLEKFAPSSWDAKFGSYWK